MQLWREAVAPPHHVLHVFDPISVLDPAPERTSRLAGYWLRRYRAAASFQRNDCRRGSEHDRTESDGNQRRAEGKPGPQCDHRTSPTLGARQQSEEETQQSPTDADRRAEQTE